MSCVLIGFNLRPLWSFSEARGIQFFAQSKFRFLLPSILIKRNSPAPLPTTILSRAIAVQNHITSIAVLVQLRTDAIRYNRKSDY